LSSATAPAAALSIIDQMLRPYAVIFRPLGHEAAGAAHSQRRL
jgi:hypothetical protein